MARQDYDRSFLRWTVGTIIFVTFFVTVVLVAYHVKGLQLQEELAKPYDVSEIGIVVETYIQNSGGLFGGGGHRNCLIEMPSGERILFHGFSDGWDTEDCTFLEGDRILVRNSEVLTRL